jgi:hypothetical protein
MDSLLEGGFRNGRYAIFGDFENQVLTDVCEAQRSLESLNQVARPAKWRLTENCRNYRIVGDTAVSLSGLGNRVYSGYMKVGGTHEHYDIQFYKGHTQRPPIISQWIREFISAGYKPRDITLLSFKAEDHGLLTALANMGLAVRHASDSGSSMSWASIHSFKGLENRVILITDASVGSHDFDRYLFYVGMTRATDSVRVLCDDSSKPVILRWLQTGRGG